MLLTSSIKYTPNFKGGAFISDAVVQFYLYCTVLLNKAWTRELSMGKIFDKDLNRFICSG